MVSIERIRYKKGPQALENADSSSFEPRAYQQLRQCYGEPSS